MDGDWARLETVVAEVLADCDNKEEQQKISERSVSVRACLVKLVDNVEAKATAYQILTAHLQACSAAEKKISQLRRQLQHDKLTADQISQLQADLDEAQSQLLQLEFDCPELKAAISRANLVIKDRTTDIILNLNANIRKMLADADSVNSQLCAKAKRLTKISEMLHIYTNTKTSVQNNLHELQHSITAAVVEELSLTGIKAFMDHLLGVQKHFSDSKASYVQLNFVKQQLAALDPLSVAEIENDIEVIEAARDTLEGTLSDSIDLAAVVIVNWQAFDETRCGLESVLMKAKSQLMKPTQLGSLQALRETLAQTKVLFVMFAI